MWRVAQGRGLGGGVGLNGACSAKDEQKADDQDVQDEQRDCGQARAVSVLEKGGRERRDKLRMTVRTE